MELPAYVTIGVRTTAIRDDSGRITHVLLEIDTGRGYEPYSVISAPPEEVSDAT
jgi:hypothetical protein